VTGSLTAGAVAVPDTGPSALLLLTLTGPITRRISRRLVT
jgi:hypothetical protein